jgi:hypothetical protein
MSQQPNTTFLIIHGGGPHKPFRTLNEFVVNFWDALDPAVAQHYAWEHRARRRDGWLESYVSLVPGESAGLPTVHFHEYYWDRLRTRRVTSGELFRWKWKAMRSHESLVAGIRYNAMLALLRLFYKSGRRTVSDLVLYTSPDVRSENFVARTQIQHEVVDTLAQLIRDGDRDRIVVFGHSLGAFIAYDALNRVTRAINCREGVAPEGSRLGPGDADDARKKLVGLVTCGSGLQVVADASWRLALEDDRTQPRGTSQWAVKQMREQRRGFKREPRSHGGPVFDSPFDGTALETEWIHFHHKRDEFSEELGKRDETGKKARSADFLPDQTRECKWPGIMMKAHNAYWKDPELYRRLADEFVFDSP